MTAHDSKGDIVLIVDDSPDALGMLNDALDAAGLTVLVALEGHQALAITQRIVPDVILLDAIMPNMDGFETCRRLKQDQRLADVPVLFMTGLSETEHIVAGLKAGGVDYLTKPVSPDEVIARLRVHLANARVTRSVRNAMDSARHYLLATDPRGNLTWATPQARHLLDEAGASADWLATEFPGLLRFWLSKSPTHNQSTMLQGLASSLQIQFIDRSADEVLLRLIDTRGPSGAEALRAALPVTERESDVLLWIARGKTNREIGEILAMSPRTVNKHLEQIFRKLGVENRTAAAAMALAHIRQT